MKVRLEAHRVSNGCFAVQVPVPGLVHIERVALMGMTMDMEDLQLCYKHQQKHYALLRSVASDADGEQELLHR